MESGWVAEVDHIFSVASPLREVWVSLRQWLKTLPDRPSREDMKAHAVLQLSFDDKLTDTQRGALAHSFGLIAGAGMVALYALG